MAFGKPRWTRSPLSVEFWAWHVRELHGKCLWPIDVKHSPGNSCLAWRSDFPADDLAAVARCYAGQIQRLLAIALSQRQRSWAARCHLSWENNPLVNLCALSLKTLFTCWPLHVANTPLNCKLNISMIFSYFRLHEHIVAASGSATRTSATASASSS